MDNFQQSYCFFQNTVVGRACRPCHAVLSREARQTRDGPGRAQPGWPCQAPWPSTTRATDRARPGPRGIDYRVGPIQSSWPCQEPRPNTTSAVDWARPRPRGVNYRACLTHLTSLTTAFSIQSWVMLDFIWKISHLFMI